MKRILSGVIVLVVCMVSGALLPAPAAATAYDFLAAGTRYTCTTYAGHANYFSSSGRAFTADIEMPEGTPIYAPEAGTVQQVSVGWGGGYGNGIVWTSADGREQIHIAHMRDVSPKFASASASAPGTGVPVASGEVIGHVGSTGQCTPADFSHLHIERAWDGRVRPLVLSGMEIDPWAAPTLTSAGPRPRLALSPSLRKAEDIAERTRLDGSGRVLAMSATAAEMAMEPEFEGSCPYCGASVSAAFDPVADQWQTPWPGQHDMGCPARLGWRALP